LHVAPCERTTFEGQFNQTEVTDSIIKCESVSKIAPWPIAVAKRAIEVEITEEYPVIQVKDIMISEPVDELRSCWVVARSVHCGEFPSVRVMYRSEANGYTIALLIQYNPRENRAIPKNKDAPGGTDRWDEIKTVKTAWSKLPDERDVKNFSFRLLQANDRASTFLNLVTHCIPFFRAIYPTYIPAKNIPITCIHWETDEGM
jgi:hypothetical protein